MLLILCFSQAHRVSVPWILNRCLRRGHDVFWCRVGVGINQKIIDVNWHARARISQLMIDVRFLICLCLWKLHWWRANELWVRQVAKDAISSGVVDLW